MEKPAAQNGKSAKAPINPHLAATISPPVMAARRWIEAGPPPKDKPLINLSQAAPALPPPEPLMAAMARILREEPSAHLYGPVLGLPALREALAADMAAEYGTAEAPAHVGPENIAITAGCNEAFAAAISSLAGAGDNVIVPVPWYFNHAMWLTQNGIFPRPLATGTDLLPDPKEAAALIDERTRAIVLVTPNNPAGVEYPADLVAAFAELAARHGIALILDETYRDFRAASGPPHDLFADPGWSDTLIHLYSFSKAFRLTGHRVGALATSPLRLAQIEKFLDTVTICAPQIGQYAALWGLENLKGWLAEEREETLARAAFVRERMAELPGWRLEGLGAYFAWLAHPFGQEGRGGERLDGETLARRLLSDAGLLLLPGEMFAPQAPEAARSCGTGRLRLAFANADRATLDEAFDRLVAFTEHLSG